MNKEGWALIETNEGVGIILLTMLDVALKCNETNVLVVDMAANPDEYETVFDTHRWVRENNKRLRKQSGLEKI